MTPTLLRLEKWSRIGVSLFSITVTNIYEFGFKSNGNFFAAADFAFGTGAGDNAYIAYNNVPMGVTHFNGRLFITMPRRRTGIPSTLNVIDLGSKKLTQSPLLTGYPSYEINALDVSISLFK